MAKEKIELPQMKPSLYVNEKDLPDIKDWKVGSEYSLKVKVKMRRLAKDDENPKKKVMATASFDVLSMESIKEQEPDKNIKRKAIEEKSKKY